MKLKHIAFAAAMALAAPAAIAQQSPAPTQQAQGQSFSDADLKQFVAANERLMVVQQESETAMKAILDEEKLSVDKFNQMAQAHQQQKLNEVEATVEEKAAFNKAAQRLMEMQPEVQKSVETAIQQDGLTLEKYEKMMMAYRQDPALQERVNTMMGQQ